MKMTALINVAKTPGDGIDAPTHQHMRKKLRHKGFQSLDTDKTIKDSV